MLYCVRVINFRIILILLLLIIIISSGSLEHRFVCGLCAR